MTKLVLYPLAAVGAATTALVAAFAAICREERRIEDARIDRHLRTLAEVRPPVLTDESLAELEQLWAESS